MENAPVTIFIKSVNRGFAPNFEYSSFLRYGCVFLRNKRMNSKCKRADNFSGRWISFRKGALILEKNKFVWREEGEFYLQNWESVLQNTFCKYTHRFYLTTWIHYICFSCVYSPWSFRSNSINSLLQVYIKYVNIWLTFFFIVSVLGL